MNINGYRGDISIAISTVNTDEKINLDFEISLDAGKTYYYLSRNHFEGLTSDISTTSSLLLTWLSSLEIRDNQDEVRLRVTPYSETDRKKPFLSSIFKVKNDPSNTAPTATSLTTSGLRNDIEISLNLRDFENDPIDIIFEYSRDNGINWQRSINVDGQLSAISVPTTHTFVWKSLSDITQTTTVLVRVTPNDQGLILASPSNSAEITLNNSNTLPYTQITQVLGDKHELTITFDSIDSDLAETLSYQFQYSLDGGGTWNSTQNVDNLTSSAPTMNQTFAWNSLKDIYDNQSSVQIRILPRDSVSVGYAIPSLEFELSNNNWFEGIGLQRLRRSHTATLFDQKIYIWGGVDVDNKLLDSMDVYDLRRGTWSRASSGGTARREHTASIHSGRIYFWGGRSEDGNLSSLDIYDIDQDQWLVGASGGRSRSSHSAVVYDQKIYYWGGLGFTTAINTMDIYNIVSNSWETGPSGGTPRSEHSAILNDSRLIFWGE